MKRLDILKSFTKDDFIYTGVTPTKGGIDMEYVDYLVKTLLDDVLSNMKTYNYYQNQFKKAYKLYEEDNVKNGVILTYEGDVVEYTVEPDSLELSFNSVLGYNNKSLDRHIFQNYKKDLGPNGMDALIAHELLEPFCSISLEEIKDNTKADYLKHKQIRDAYKYSNTYRDIGIRDIMNNILIKDIASNYDKYSNQFSLSVNKVNNYMLYLVHDFYKGINTYHLINKLTDKETIELSLLLIYPENKGKLYSYLDMLEVKDKDYVVNRAYDRIKLSNNFCKNKVYDNFIQIKNNTIGVGGNIIESYFETPNVLLTIVPAMYIINIRNIIETYKSLSKEEGINNDIDIVYIKDAINYMYSIISDKKAYVKLKDGSYALVNSFITEYQYMYYKRKTYKSEYMYSDISHDTILKTSISNLSDGYIRTDKKKDNEKVLFENGYTLKNGYFA